MIRVLQVLNSFGSANGIASFLFSYYQKGLAVGLGEEMKTDFVILQDDPESPRQKAVLTSGAKVFVLPWPSFRKMGYIKKEFAKILDENHYDVVHCHLANAAYVFLGVAKRKGIPCRILHAHATKWADSALKAIRNRFLAKLGLRKANARLACSEAAGKFLFGKKEFLMIPNAVEPSRFAYSTEKRKAIREAYHIPDSAFLLGTIGRLNPQKNQAFLLPILAEFRAKNAAKDGYLMIVGNGPLEAELKQKAKEMGLPDKVIFTGLVDNANEFYNAFDCFLLPSLFEGLPVVGIEAQFNGLPCLFSSSITTETAISSNVQFLDGYDAAQWAEAISKSQRDEGSLIEKSKDYDIGSSAGKLLSFYKECLTKQEKR